MRFDTLSDDKSNHILQINVIRVGRGRPSREERVTEKESSRAQFRAIDKSRNSGKEENLQLKMHSTLSRGDIRRDTSDESKAVYRLQFFSYVRQKQGYTCALTYHNAHKEHG